MGSLVRSAAASQNPGAEKRKEPRDDEGGEGNVDPLDFLEGALLNMTTGFPKDRKASPPESKPRPGEDELELAQLDISGAEDVGAERNPIDLVSSKASKETSKRKSGNEDTKRPAKRPNLSPQDGGTRKTSKRRPTPESLSRKGQNRSSRSANAGAADQEQVDAPPGTEDALAATNDEESAQVEWTHDDLEGVWLQFLRWLKDCEQPQKTYEKYERLMARALALLAKNGEIIMPPEVDDATDPRKLYTPLQKEINEAEKQLRKRLHQEKKDRQADRRDMARAAVDLGPGDVTKRIPIAGQFSFLASIGQGGQGHAGLWVEYDDHGSIIQRVVLKESYVDPEGDWNLKKWWFGPPENRHPLEASILGDLSNIDTEALCVVRFLAYAVYEKKRMYRTYCELCPHGDLKGVVRNHLKLRSSYTTYGKPRKYQVPTLALWAIFEALAKAAYVLFHGKLPEVEKLHRWRKILHRDIKPHNVFLSHPNKETWRSIPVAKLGDFGMAIPQAEEASQRPGHGTPVYMAPEQVLYFDENKLPMPAAAPISSAADVWSIGMTMLELMQLLLNEESCTYLNKKTPSFSREALDAYPESLRLLVTQCPKFEPGERISVTSLYHAIEEEVTKSDRDAQSLPLRQTTLGREDIFR